MTPHNEAKKEDIANIVIMPGDPLRAKYIAENFLEDAKLVNTVRNMFAYTGTYKGKRLKIYFTSQTGITPPKFTFHVNNKGLVHFSYERYLENKIRENFDFEGTPIIFQFKNRNE